MAALAAACLASPARAQTKPVIVEGLALETGQTSYKIPKLTAEGTALTALDIARIFDAKDAATVDERLARLTATRILIPEMRAETKSGERQTLVVYRDVTLENVAAGRIGVMRAAAMEQSATGKGAGRVEARYSGLVAKGVDMRQFAHVISAPRAEDKEAVKTIEEETSIESVSILFPDAGLDIRLGRVAASGLRARALAESPLHLAERSPPSGASPTQEQSAAMALALVDALGSVEVGAIEARDISVVGLSAPANKPFAIKIGRVALNRLAAGTAQEAAVDNFSLESADGGHIALRNLALRGLDLNALVRPGERRTWKLDHAQLADLAADLPDANSDGRIKFRIVGLSADFANYRENVPTKIKARLDRFNIDLAARGDMPATAQFTALGYRDVEFSGDLQAEWREQGQELVVDQLRLDSKDMGAITLAASLGNVSAALFSSSPIVSKAAALTMNATRLEATLEGGGLIDRLMEQDAKAGGGDIGKLRVAYAHDISSATSGFFDNSEKARRIGDAAGKFILRPKRLHIKLTAPKGIGALEAAMKKPGEILNEVEVEAAAE